MFTKTMLHCYTSDTIVLLELVFPPIFRGFQVVLVFIHVYRCDDSINNIFGYSGSLLKSTTQEIFLHFEDVCLVFVYFFCFFVSVLFVCSGDRCARSVRPGREPNKYFPVQPDHFFHFHSLVERGHVRQHFFVSRVLSECSLSLIFKETLFSNRIVSHCFCRDRTRFSGPITLRTV